MGESPIAHVQAPKAEGGKVQQDNEVFVNLVEDIMINQSLMESVTETNEKRKRKTDQTLESKGPKKKKTKKSAGEQQVPLKITFKSPPPNNKGKRGRKPIKLRVKTQTTSDNGFKIQIQQPKTKHPLKFK